MGPVDTYIATLQEPQKSCISALFAEAQAHIPDAGQTTSYSLAALTYKKKPVIAFVAYKQHISAFPFSGQVVADTADLLGDFEHSKGTVRFSVEQPISSEIVKRLVLTRMAQIDLLP